MTILLSGFLAACGQHPNLSINPLPSPARPAAITVAATGGLSTGDLASITPELAGADLAVCHLEQPLPSPIAPQVASIATAGFDTCSTASNHTLDAGAEELARTLDSLDKAGIRHAGSARSAQEATTPVIFNVRGVSVGHLSYTFSFNGLEAPEGKQWMVNLIDKRQILTEARRAKQAGAEIVLLSLHWGPENQHEPDIEQSDLARELLADPAIDLILGHHVHVLQSFEKLGDKWVAYGLGDLLTESALPTFTFTEQSPRVWRVTRLSVAATARALNLTTALHSPSTTDSQRLNYTRALKRIKTHINLRNAMRDGLRIAHSH